MLGILMAHKKSPFPVKLESEEEKNGNFLGLTA